MIVVGILIALLIAVTGGMIVAIYLRASTMLAGLSWVGLITGGVFTFLQLPLDFHSLGFLGGDFVVCSRGYQVDVRMWLILINLDRKKKRFLTTRASTTKFALRLNSPTQKTSALRVN